MASIVRNYLAISIGVVLLKPIGALAAPRTAGDTIVYDVREMVQSTPSVPPRMSAENRAKMEAAQNKPQNFVLTLKLDEVAPDGKAQAHASLVNSSIANAPASLRDPSSNFIAALAPDGEILAQYDPQFQPKTGAGGVILNAAELTMNNVGGQVMPRLAYFNAFAKGCTTHSLAGSTTWHETMMDALLGQRTLTFTSTGSKAIVMKNVVKNQYMTQTMSASGHCDRASRLVLDYHEEVENTMSSGPPSSITRDFVLRR